jgi:ribose transport system ATP-binding protein
MGHAVTDTWPPAQLTVEQMAVCPALQVNGVSKTFAARRVLSSVELSVYPGEVHALLGQNGSGKSTLIKVLSGYHEPDAGSEVLIDGEPLAFGSPAASHKAGLRFVHQDLGLIDAATVLDNIAFGTGYTTRGGTIRRRESTRLAQAALDLAGSDVSPKQMVRELSPSQRTGVAVARALARHGSDVVRVLVLDEPTATLPVDEVDQLLAMLRASADSGAGVVLVTHRLDEVFKIADRVTVLRDGNVVVTSAMGDVNRRGLVHKLIGADLEQAQRDAVVPEVADAGATAGLRVDGLRALRINGISFQAKPGEVLGIYGLTGSGRETVLSAVFGALPRDSGEVRIDGQRVRSGSPRHAIGAGIGYLPPDRKIRAGLMLMPAYENVTLLDLKPYLRWWTVRKKPELADARAWFQKLEVRPADAITAPLSSFSGGNQQKILFAKWLRLQPKALLLDEPAQGVDIGAKVTVHQSILDAAQAGAAVVVSSSDEDELAAICTRILIMQNGEITDELTDDRISVSALNSSMHAEPQHAAPSASAS